MILVNRNQFEHTIVWLLRRKNRIYFNWVKVIFSFYQFFPDGFIFLLCNNSSIFQPIKVFPRHVFPSIQSVRFLNCTYFELLRIFISIVTSRIKYQITSTRTLLYYFLITSSYSDKDLTYPSLVITTSLTLKNYCSKVFSLSVLIDWSADLFWCSY